MSNELRQFIIDYLNKDDCPGVSVLDSDFHNAVSEKFPSLKRKMNNWGCQPVYAAMRELSKMYDEFYVLKSRISLGANWQPGFPKSVITYYIVK